MQEEEEYDLQQSAAQYIVATNGREGAHGYSSATTGGGEYSGSALRGHWNNTRTAYENDYCNGTDHTDYRGDKGYGYYNSDGYYTGVGPDNYGNNSCGYNAYEVDDGQYGCYDDTYGGNYCKSVYGGDYDGYVGTETDAYRTTHPPRRGNISKYGYEIKEKTDENSKT